jgi:hypothetical protein
LSVGVAFIDLAVFFLILLFIQHDCEHGVFFCLVVSEGNDAISRRLEEATETETEGSEWRHGGVIAGG